MSEIFKVQCYSTADRKLPTTDATWVPTLRLKHQTNKHDNLNAILHVKRPADAFLYERIWEGNLTDYTNSLLDLNNHSYFKNLRYEFKRERKEKPKKTKT